MKNNIRKRETCRQGLLFVSLSLVHTGVEVNWLQQKVDGDKLSTSTSTVQRQCGRASTIWYSGAGGWSVYISIDV